jgi:formate dehydrogenase major subunit
LKKRHLRAGDRVDIFAIADDGIERVIRNFKVVEYALPDGCCGAYYPEVNPLVPLYAFDPQSRTPSYKSVPVRVVSTATAPEAVLHAIELQHGDAHHA